MNTLLRPPYGIAVVVAQFIPDKSGFRATGASGQVPIYRHPRFAGDAPPTCSGDESPDYRETIVQLRKSYVEYSVLFSRISPKEI